MHELSLVHALFDQADRAVLPHGPERVRRVEVAIGALAGVEVDLFRTAFEIARLERGYRSAELAIEHVPAEHACSVCGARPLAGAPLACPCGGRVALTRGGDLILERIELEVPDV